MLDKLVEFFLDFIELFYVTTVIDQYQEGVMLRFGKYHRDLLPGLHLRLPLNIEVPLSISVVPDATTMPEQTFTLVDGTTVAVVPVLTYRVHNTRKVLLEVEDAEASMLDSCSGVMRRLMTPHGWEDFVDPDKCAEIEAAISKEIRQEAFRWGFEVLRASFPSFVKLDGAYRISGVELAL